MKYIIHKIEFKYFFINNSKKCVFYMKALYFRDTE